MSSAIVTGGAGGIGEKVPVAVDRAGVRGEVAVVTGGAGVRGEVAVVTGEAGVRGEVAVVTGGAGGIGGGVVDALMAAGIPTAVLDLRPNPAATLTLKCDVTSSDAVAAAISEVVAELGAPSRLVCSAGVVSEAPLDELPVAEWHRVVDISMTSAYLALRAVLPAMVARGGGTIVTMSSGWGRKGYPFGAHYAAAKSGIEALTKSVALEYAARDIRCNCVAPGPVRTAMVEDNPNFDEAGRAAMIPLGRIGEVPDVVDPIMFLLGDGARYITGQILHVNGGMLMP
jgi:NAD(P)-dependent dehydrogenase (short-subunit alcohol dehydrogenase family)